MGGDVGDGGAAEVGAGGCVCGNGVAAASVVTLFNQK